MAQTSASSATAYATVADLVLYHDARMIGKYLNDDGTTVAPSALSGNAVVLAHLLAGAGMIEMRCKKGGRYSAEDLNALLGAGQAALKKLNADIAFSTIVGRRNPVVYEQDVWKNVQATLESLGLGEEIFPFEETAEAGEGLDTVDMSTNSIAQSSEITDVAGRFFGVRAKDLINNNLSGCNPCCR